MHMIVNASGHDWSDDRWSLHYSMNMYSMECRKTLELQSNIKLYLHTNIKVLVLLINNLQILGYS